jgi:hypothetical protein
MPLLSPQDVQVSNIGPGMRYPDPGLPQSLQVNTDVVSQIKPQLPLFHIPSIHYSPISLSLDAIKCDRHTASLNKAQINKYKSTKDIKRLSTIHLRTFQSYTYLFLGVTTIIL